MKLKGLKFPVLLLVVVVTAVAASATAIILFERSAITILNANPYPCVVAVRYEVAPSDWRTVGWMRLEPGERKRVAATFYRVTPQFYVAAESRDMELLKWLSETGEGVIYFSGDEAVKGSAPKNRDLDAEGAAANGGFEEIEFSRAKAGEDIYVLTDALFHDAILRNEEAEIGTEEEGFELIREKAGNLYKSLHRQKRFEETFKSEKDFPFAFEFAMSDAPAERGFMYLGVTLSNVLPHTLHGDKTQLRGGDVLVGIRSGEEEVTPIYTPADAYTALHAHGVDTEKGGISKPLHFLVIRDNELLQIESYFLFNPAFDWPETEGEAFTGAFTNSLLMGFRAEVVGFFSDDPQASWKETQRLKRLSQFFPDSTTAGDLLGILVPTPTKVLKLGKVARGGRLLRSTRAAAQGLSIELLRVAVYSYKTSMPAPQSKKLTPGDLRDLFPGAMGINLIRGAGRDHAEPSFKLRKRTFGHTR
jgi:hypothetical protein